MSGNIVGGFLLFCHLQHGGSFVHLFLIRRHVITITDGRLLKENVFIFM